MLFLLKSNPYSQSSESVISIILQTAFFMSICKSIFLQELFSKQKGFLEEELDYRKQALDQAYMVGVLYLHYTMWF